MTRLSYRILGSLEALRAGERLGLGGHKQRTLLALLLLNANRVVTNDALVEALWPQKAPGKPLTAIQGYVSSLRKLLHPQDPFSVIVTEPAGYRLPLEPAQLDLHRFEELLASGREALAAGDATSADGALSDALSLFHGSPLADFTYEQWATLEIARLEELRLVCQEEAIEAGLALGRHAELVATLEALIARHPLRERPRGQLMLALYRSGRQSEALAAYQEARHSLVEEFGIEPTPALQELERAILRQDEGLGAPARGPATVPSPAPARELTLMFTDIEGSTRLLRRLGDAYGAVLVEHRRVLREAVEARGGRVVDSYGDGFFASFTSAADAVEAAAAAQRALAGYPWPEASPVRVRMGVHTGRPIAVGTGLVGLDVHRVARICAASHGGQVLLSDETAAALDAAALGALALRDVGVHPLRDIARPERLHQLVGPGLPDGFPAPRIDVQPSPVPRPDRSILVLEGEGGQAGQLDVAEALARSHVPHELIIARLIASAGHDTETALELRLASAASELIALRTDLAERGVASRVAVFTTEDIGEDAARLATEQAADLLLLGRAATQLSEGAFDAETAGVFTRAPCHVGICVASPRAVRRDGAVLVPFGGTEHDWAALELAAWLASATGSVLRLLGSAGAPQAGKRDASRLLASASLAVQQLVGVPTEPDLVARGPEALVEAASAGSLVVVGVPEDWRAAGLGSTRRRLALAVGRAVIVKRGMRPGGLAPRGSQTRFSWSIADVVPASDAGDRR